jgi:hypothetical protein
MPDTLSTTETTLNSLFTTLYPNLSDENPTSTNSPLETFEHSHTIPISDPEINTARNTFLINWKASVEIESAYIAETSKPHQTSAVRKLILQLEEERKKAHKETNNTLSLYVYTIVKNKLKSTVTPETIRETTNTLKSYILSLNGDEKSVNLLVQQLQIVHGKQREFTTELVAVLQKESLLQHAGLRRTNTELLKEKDKLEKKWKAAEEKIKESRDELSKLDQLKKDNATILKLLDDSQTHVEKIQEQLQDAEKYNASCSKRESELEANVKILEQQFKVATENADQLKRALETQQKHTDIVESNSIEANGILENEKSQLETHLTTSKKNIETLNNQLVTLQKEVDSIKQLNTQIIQTKEKTHKNFVAATLQNRKYETEIKDLRESQDILENKIVNLENRIIDLKEREKAYQEAEDLYEKNFQEIADKTFETTKFLDELQNFTVRDSIDKSLHTELDTKNSDTVKHLQDIIDNLTVQNNSQASTIFKLQKRNTVLKKNRRISISTMGLGAGASQSDDDDANSSQLTNTLANVPDTTILDNVTKPIVKVLGELFSREDKKSIPTFKGKSTDKLITEWLKAAEHVARNNDWDDDQKIRFFSDRLKGEALEWHDNYAESQGDELNYTDWRSEIIERFQDSFDLAALKKKFNKLKQKPEENCRTFVSRLVSLYDSIEGKIGKLDDKNKTDVEDALLNTVKKMRDDIKIKTLLQGILPKVKAELYLRMPEDFNDFDQLCRQLFISEQILQNKENNEDKEITAVIAGITHHERQQDDALTQQKTDIDIIKQQLAELGSLTKKRHSSQDNLATIGAVDRYDSRRAVSLDRRPRQEDSRVHFDRPREGSSRTTENRDSNYNHSRDNSYSRSRDQSPSRHRDRSDSSYNRQSYSRTTDSRYNYNRFRTPRQNNYTPRFANRPFRTGQNYGERRNSYNNAPRAWPTVQNNNAYNDRTNNNHNQRIGQRDIVCHKCNKRGHIARECWTDMARINRQYNRS